MSWWQFWKHETESAPAAETRRKSVTAMLDGVIAKVEADQEACDQEANRAARRSANASRKVIMRTGQFEAAGFALKKDKAPTA
jgi:hypothetical protein